MKIQVMAAALALVEMTGISAAAQLRRRRSRGTLAPLSWVQRCGPSITTGSRWHATR
jgi:hypothetical protein